MKKITKLFMLPLMAVALTGCDFFNKPAEEEPSGEQGGGEKEASISLDKASLTLKVGTESTLVATTQEGTGLVSWTSSDPAVATVDALGKVTAVGKGEATITASYSGKTATCSVLVKGIDDLYYLSGVQENENIARFHTNVLDSEDEFRGETSPILNVGDDNAVQLKPRLLVRDDETDLPVDQSIWDAEFGYTYEALEWGGSEYGALSGEYFAFDAIACTFDFNESAIGKQFKITVIPGGLDEEDRADPEYRVSVELKVNNGYNVYSAKELAYANDINFLKDDRQGNDDIIADINQAWKNYRAANGLSVDYVAPAIYLQANMEILASSLPSEFFYSASDAGVQPEWIGKMKDATDVYCHYARDYEFNGNYFHIDTSKLPLGVDNLGYNDNVSHSTLFKTVLRELSETEAYVDVSFKNCTYYGNSPRGNNSEDSMGLIFFKIRNSFYTHWTDELSVEHENKLVIRGIFDNFNVTRACISFFGEVGRNELVIKDCEVREGYSNGMYLWNNGNVQFINSKMANFGGPVIITDGDGDDEGRMDTYKGFHITADDATIFDNKVTGVEPWFTNTMGGLPATKITDIKALNGLVQYNSGGTKSFVKGDNEEMNMIIINYGEIPYLEFKKGDAATIGYDTDSALCPTIDGILALGAPVFNTDNGAMGYYNPNVHPYELQPVIPGALGGEFLDIIYALPAEGFVNNTLNLSIVFGL